jgi:AraC-like DNA-binding protein
MVKYSAMLLEIALTLHILIIALKHWRDDLIQERRYIRCGVITFSGSYILINIFANQLIDIHWQLLDLFMMSLMAMLVTGVNTFLFKLRESSLFVLVVKKTTTTIEVKSIKELGKINQAMDDEKLYRQEGITIASFAKHLAIHEYKLRQVINGELNFRNFNDFLNAYRIKEVTENLVAPSSQDTPILTIALDSGFRSLSSFNKAFKTIHGITPTAYRKKLL